jgi:hypothetical protein
MKPGPADRCPRNQEAGFGAVLRMDFASVRGLAVGGFAIDFAGISPGRSVAALPGLVGDFTAGVLAGAPEGVLQVNCFTPRITRT